MLNIALDQEPTMGGGGVVAGVTGVAAATKEDSTQEDLDSDSSDNNSDAASASSSASSSSSASLDGLKTEIADDIAVELLPKPRRGRRSSINHMPDSSRLEYYKKTIGHGAAIAIAGPIPPSTVKRSTDLLSSARTGGRGRLFEQQDARASQKQVREASYKRLMKARAETRARKSVKDKRIIRPIYEIPIEWHGTQSLIQTPEDGAAAWQKSLFDMLAGSSGGHGSGGHGHHHHGEPQPQQQQNHNHNHSPHHHHHHHHHPRGKDAKKHVKKNKTALEKQLDARSVWQEEAKKHHLAKLSKLPC